MKVSLILFFCLFLLPDIFAQSTDDIIRKHIEAVGGEENWRKIETIVITGSTKRKGNRIELTKSAVRDTLLRSDIRMVSRDAGRSDKFYYVLIVGEKGWKYLPEDRNNTIYPLYEAEVTQYKDELDYEDPFIRYLEKGRQINMIGLEYYHGMEYYKFLIQYKSGRKANCYMNSTTLMIDVMEVVNGETEILQRYLNYETLPEGIVLPKKNIGTAGEFKISSVIINQPIPESMYTPSERNRYFMRR